METIALFLIRAGLEFIYYPQTKSFVYVKSFGKQYFFEERDGVWRYVINNDDEHTWIDLGGPGNTIEFINQ